jgi:hypothetical protein
LPPDPQEDVIEAVGVVQLLGTVGDHHCQPRGWGVGLPTLRRFFPIGSFYGPFRLGLLSVLSRLRSGGTGLSARCRNFSPFTGNAKLSGTGVQVRSLSSSSTSRASTVRSGP